MRRLTQLKVAAHLSLATLLERKASSLVIVACMACVVGALLSVLAVTMGLLRAFEISGSPARAIVSTSTSAAPARVRVSAQADTVAPVVNTSSINSTRWPAIKSLRRTEKAFATLSRRALASIPAR